MKISVFFITISLVLSLTNCSDDTKRKVIERKPKKPALIVRYFRDKKISSHNHYRHIHSTFIQEILGYPDEKIQSLKSLEKDSDSFYKVYYTLSKHVIKSEYYEHGYLKSYSEYAYGKRKTLVAGKLIRVKHFNDKKEEVALEEVSYDQFGRADKTTRYTLQPTKKLHNIH